MKDPLTVTPRLVRSGNNGSNNQLDLPPVMTVAELQALLRLGRSAAYSLVRSGVMPGVVRCGRYIRISRDAVLDWLASGGNLTY